MAKIGGSSLKELMTNEGKPVRNNAVYNEILAAQFEPLCMRKITFQRKWSVEICLNRWHG